MKNKVKNIIGAVLLVAGLIGGALMIANTVTSVESAPVAVESVDMDRTISVLP